MPEWKKNLLIIWVCQFITLAGFWFVIPFIPYYIQLLGAKDKTEINLWVTLFTMAGYVSIAVFSPMWGKLADRHGRKLMLLRANFCNALVIPMMGYAPNVSVLVLLRLLMGIFSGTTTASQTLISSCTPFDKRGRAMGILSSANFAGSLVGSFCGGIFVDAFGYKSAFWLCCLLYLFGVFLIYFGVSEKSLSKDNLPIPLEANTKCSFKLFQGPLKYASTILLLILFMGLARRLDQPFLPLLVQDIHGSIKGAATWTGIICGIAALAGIISGPIIGLFSDKISIPKIASISAIGAGVFMLCHAFAYGMTTLTIVRFIMIFFAGGLDPVFQIWLAKSTPDHIRGTIFGWAVTAKCLGWVLASVLGGTIATFIGIRWIYIIGCLLFILHIPFIKACAKQNQNSSA